MRQPGSPNRYVLVPRTTDATADGPGANSIPRPIKRYSLARIGVSPRSALGEDRHQRLERAAGHDNRP
jgi:hypothetical protein